MSASATVFVTETPGGHISRIAAELEDARVERDLAMATVEDVDEALGAWDRKLIDQAISSLAEAGRPFSANDMRDLLPDVRPALIGRRFQAHAIDGRIRRVGMTPSTKKNTHGKDVALWLGVATTEGANP